MSSMPPTHGDHVGLHVVGDQQPKIAPLDTIPSDRVGKVFVVFLLSERV